MRTIKKLIEIDDEDIAILETLISDSIDIPYSTSTLEAIVDQWYEAPIEKNVKEYD